MEKLSEYCNVSDSPDSEASKEINPGFYNPPQAQLQAELKDAIRRHYKYLNEVEEMENVILPTWYLIIKRFMDVSVAILGTLLLSPLFIIVIFAIMLDSPGPILYGQVRVGKNGKLFKIYKFRTMVTDAEKKTGPVWAIEKDPRITYLGNILRKTKIDEFPQFINLIKGEMSMVGPRPERPFFVDQFANAIPGYSRRLDVIPGITGPAQLRNGYDTCAMSVIKKLRYDITYVKRMNLYMDLGLLIETFISIFKGKF